LSAQKLPAFLARNRWRSFYINLKKYAPFYTQLFMPVTWYDTRITRIETAAPNVRRFWLERPAGLLFEAGQFITLDLPIGDKRLQRWRSYSIASAPQPFDADLELCIVRSAEGAGTRYLFEEVEVGSDLRWKGPDGAFVLPTQNLAQQDLVLICTGTGVAPFRSMIRAVVEQNIPHHSIHLIFGTRTEADILYRQEFEALAQSLPSFRYDVALSRQSDWSGHCGHVHPIYQAAYATPRPDVRFMICGWSRMIDEAVANLIVTMGYERQQVGYELYG
jgi:ferredoxin-NADP reductase